MIRKVRISDGRFQNVANASVECLVLWSTAVQKAFVQEPPRRGLLRYRE